MEIIGTVIIIVVILIVFSICSYCCRKHRGKVLGPPSQPGLTVTTTTSVPVAQPPYPVAPQHPVPQPMMAPGIGFHNAPPAGYPPYPVAQGPPMPQPYPPVSNQAMAPPPSYHEAVGQPLSGPSVTKEHYAQQSPYNPHY